MFRNAILFAFLLPFSNAGLLDFFESEVGDGICDYSKRPPDDCNVCLCNPKSNGWFCTTNKCAPTTQKPTKPSTIREETPTYFTRIMTLPHLTPSEAIYDESDEADESKEVVTGRVFTSSPEPSDDLSESEVVTPKLSNNPSVTEDLVTGRIFKSSPKPNRGLSKSKVVTPKLSNNSSETED